MFYCKKLRQGMSVFEKKSLLSDHNPNAQALLTICKSTYPEAYFQKILDSFDEVGLYGDRITKFFDRFGLVSRKKVEGSVRIGDSETHRPMDFVDYKLILPKATTVLDAVITGSLAKSAIERIIDGTEQVNVSLLIFAEQARAAQSHFVIE